MRYLTGDQLSDDAAREAAAICILCGAAVCPDHVRPYDVTTYSLQPGGLVAAPAADGA